VTDGWDLLPGKGGRHVVPKDDLFEHRIDLWNQCPCGPTLEAVKTTNRNGAWSHPGVMWLVVHNSLDGREAHE
jgi:hypothetical protein